MLRFLNTELSPVTKRSLAMAYFGGGGAICYQFTVSRCRTGKLFDFFM